MVLEHRPYFFPFRSVPNVTITSEGGNGGGSENGNGGGSEGGNGSGSRENSQSKPKSKVGAVVGGVVGGVVGLVLLLLLGFYLWRRFHQQRGDDEMANVYSNRPITQSVPYTYTYEEMLPRNTAGSVRPKVSQPLPGPSLPRSGMVGYGTSVAVNAGSDSSRTSTKSREPLITTLYPAPANQTEGLSSATPSGPSSSRELLSGSETDVGSRVSPSEVVGLRVEVENLRRVMQQFARDPPPTYHEGD